MMFLALGLSLYRQDCQSIQDGHPWVPVFSPSFSSSDHLVTIILLWDIWENFVKPKYLRYISLEPLLFCKYKYIQEHVEWI
jgi:hypothetical protein